MCTVCGSHLFASLSRTNAHTEYFGAEPMHSGDEHLDEESDEEGEKDDGDQVTAPPSDASPK